MALKWKELVHLVGVEPSLALDFSEENNQNQTYSIETAELSKDLKDVSNFSFVLDDVVWKEKVCTIHDFVLSCLILTIVAWINSFLEVLETSSIACFFLSIKVVEPECPLWHENLPSFIRSNYPVRLHEIILVHTSFNGQVKLSHHWVIIFDRDAIVVIGVCKISILIWNEHGEV